jgi:predicted oxidoreductase
MSPLAIAAASAALMASTSTQASEPIALRDMGSFHVGGRLVEISGKPAANMFAAGEIMAGNVLGKGYAAGIGMTIGSVFGRVAGREAAKHARN